MLTRERFCALTAAECLGVADVPRLVQFSGLQTECLAAELCALRKDGWIDSARITAAGLAALEPYRVRRAILLAAGAGVRLLPVTATVPKPLIRVNGVRIIDTLLDAILAAAITDITIVRGYLGEQFDQLLDKYPMLHFSDNPLYEATNNVSSALAVSSLLERCYIMDADLLIRNPNLITKYQYETNFLGIAVPHTDDLALFTRNGFICDYRRGGDDCYQIIGISYWTEADGKRLQKDLLRMFASEAGKTMYWEQAPLNLYLSDYRITVRDCTMRDVAEIDTVADLALLNDSGTERTEGWNE